MQKTCLVALTFLCFLTSACSPAATEPPVTLAAVSPATQTLTLSPTLTVTSQTSLTPAPPTLTPLPTIPTFTPTFDVRTIVTATPASKAECPKENQKLVADFSIPDLDSCRAGGWCYTSETANEILLFLNQGGSISAVIGKLEKVINKSVVTGGNFFFYDLTKDSVLEIMFRDFSVVTGIHIFTCKAGKYRLFNALSDYPMQIYAIEDLNKNGIPELIISGGFCSGSGCAVVGVYEWDGENYRELSNNGIRISGPKAVNFQDYNSDGMKDNILVGERPGSCCMDLTIPWRYKTVVYSWNGNTYSESYVTFEPAHYRFQSVQDADREVLFGNYEIALEYYQNLIFSDKLAWWSNERREYEIKKFYDSYNPITPTPFPYPAEDPSEYPRLAAYAYFRMIILHTKLGEIDVAQTQYATLQEKFPAESPGHPYVEMANAFWDTYQSKQNMTNACGAAIQYAAEHPEILTVLGSDYHGWQSHKYVPSDVCPFR